jgi:hypothetical protein
MVINGDFELKDQGVSNALNTGDLPRHRWYFIKEGFSPRLVETALESENVSKGDLLFDPFSGGGTVPVTGAVHGMKTHSLELNPFLRFLSATKLAQAHSGALLKSSEIVKRGMGHPVRSSLEGCSTFTEGNRWKRWLFPLAVLRTYEGGRRALRNVSPTHRGLLRLGLIGAALDCCNASRDGKCLRFPKSWKKSECSAEELAGQFERRVKLLAEDVDKLPLNRANACVTQGDARKVICSTLKQKFRLCVTSPPYLNSFDYSDVYRPELFLGGFVDSNRALMKIRMQTVRSHVQASWSQPKRSEFGALYTNCISQIRDAAENLWDPRIPTMIQAYFEDMEKVLRDLHRRALDNASIWLVVSTSAYGGVQVPVDLILAEIAERAGWCLREVGVLRHLRSSSQHVKHVEDVHQRSVPLRESVVILDAKTERK